MKRKKERTMREKKGHEEKALEGGVDPWALGGDSGIKKVYQGTGWYFRPRGEGGIGGRGVHERKDRRGTFALVLLKIKSRRCSRWRRRKESREIGSPLRTVNAKKTHHTKKNTEAPKGGAD